MTVDKKAFDNFPYDFEIANKTFQFYYADGNLSKLSDAQKQLCYSFICEGLIDNSGLFSILLETQGQFNLGYIGVLEKAGELESRDILQEIDSVYRRFEKSFSSGILPDELDEESISYKRDLSERIKALENRWYDLSEQRNKKVNKYFETKKDELVRAR
jgi:hypothetical protein